MPRELLIYYLAFTRAFATFYTITRGPFSR